MQTSVIGFPRIGTLRELKFASEKYFKKEIEAGELLREFDSRILEKYLAGLIKPAFFMSNFPFLYVLVCNSVL